MRHCFLSSRGIEHSKNLLGLPRTFREINFECKTSNLDYAWVHWMTRISGATTDGAMYSSRKETQRSLAAPKKADASGVTTDVPLRARAVCGGLSFSPEDNEGPPECEMECYQCGVLLHKNRFLGQARLRGASFHDSNRNVLFKNSRNPCAAEGFYDFDS